jgi:hypothetical protein
MTAEQYRRVRDLFESALEQPSAARAAWVAGAAGDDAVVLEEVQSLLAHGDRAGAFLEAPLLDHVPALLIDETLPPGAVVGSYSIGRELGRGGMGRVYLATDSRLGRAVALKAIAPHLTRDEGSRQRLRREARAAAGLTHPGICTVYALEEIDGELYIATEYVDGHTLREEIRGGSRPDAAQLHRTARDLASALASAHDHGITHRDLKPENVMRTNDGRLKILDFGLARIDAPYRGELAPSGATAPGALPPTTPGLLVGTPGYMAPEQLQGRPVDRRADVFAFGVLLYELASGVHPFAAESPLAMLSRVIESEAMPLTATTPNVTPGLAAIVARCLRKAPADRFQSASEIVGALELAATPSSDRGRTGWWRVHQLVMAALYVTSAVLGWQIKEWIETPTGLGLFLAVGVGATIGCVLRGHVLFTERVNPRALTAEHRRIARPLLAVDLLLALALGAGGLLIVARPVTAMLTIALALGIALAATVVEPATNRSVFA